MKAINGLRILVLAGLIMFVSQIGHVAHASFFTTVGDVVGGSVDAISDGATHTGDDCSSGGISGVFGALQCGGYIVSENPQIVETCKLANGKVFTINFGDDEAAADEFVAMCETAQLQLLWYDRLVQWTAASCES